jgi:hypothetical protein
LNAAGYAMIARAIGDSIRNGVATVPQAENAAH